MGMNTWWTLGALSYFWGTPELGDLRWQWLMASIVVAYSILVILGVCFACIKQEMLALFTAVVLGMPLAVISLFVDLVIFKVDEVHLFADTLGERGAAWISVVLSCLRKVLLLAMATAAMVASWPAPGWCAILSCLQVADVIACAWL